tara:strand:+ start:323 stop:1036 length:714 start_codon:yes stop_codon:yes gene_type:complete
MAKLDRDDFYKALEAARTPMGSSKHEFTRIWADGQLSKQQLGRWAIQHYYYISTIPQQFAALYSRMPDAEGRLLLMDNLVGEDMPETPEKSHPNLMLNFAEACGVSRDDVLNAEAKGEILPGTKAMRAWIWELAKVRPISEASSGIMVALEGQLPTLYPMYINAMEKMGFTDEELEFFHVHVEADTEHAAVGLDLCYRYADTEEKQIMAIEAVRGSAAIRYNMLTDILNSIVVKNAA